MNHTNMAKLLIYLDTGVRKLSEEELRDFEWLVAQLHYEVRQHQLIMRNTPINTPAGSFE